MGQLAGSGRSRFQYRPASLFGPPTRASLGVGHSATQGDETLAYFHPDQRFQCLPKTAAVSFVPVRAFAFSIRLSSILMVDRMFCSNRRIKNRTKSFYFQRAPHEESMRNVTWTGGDSRICPEFPARVMDRRLLPASGPMLDQSFPSSGA